MDDEAIANTLHRRTAFMDDRKRSLGPEYYSSKEFWDRMWEQEWEALEDQLCALLEQSHCETIDEHFPLD